MSKRILFVGNFFDKKAGTTSPSRKVAEVLNKQGLKSSFVSSFTNRLYRVPDILMRVISYPYSILHIDVYSGNAFRIAETTARLALKRKKPYVLALHGGSLPEFFQNNADRINELFSQASFIYTPSNYLHRFFNKQNPDCAITYMPNMVDLAAFSPKPVYGPVKKLLWVRAFTPIYNPDIAPKVLHELGKDYPDLTLTMVGPDKGLLPQIKSLADDLGVADRISFTGPVPNASLPEVYRNHDVLLNTTSYESFGMSVAEAAASGLPVISSRVGELPLIWNEGSDILFTSEVKAEAFAVHLRKLLEDSQLAEELGRSASINVKNFDEEKLAQRWAHIAQSFKDF
ncbi:glycosyltransferase family 4 protein [Roseivirga sp. BDSF3-8]|uniref:glycosyltransferase family 4 protein n=1 Tax=Roseivirga sp. BDSF3-8 TaxID=3241598 RepID=UPI003531B150